jgi:hypothetical protein
MIHDEMKSLRIKDPQAAYVTFYPGTPKDCRVYEKVGISMNRIKASVYTGHVVVQYERQKPGSLWAREAKFPSSKFDISSRMDLLPPV